MNALRQLSKDILRYGLGDIAVKAVGFLTLPLYTRVLSIADYGVLSTIGSLSSILSCVTGLGMSSAVQRAYYANTDPEYRRNCVSTGFFGLAGWSVVAFALAFFAGRPLAIFSFGTTQNWSGLVLAFLAIPFLQLAAYCQDILRLEFRPYAFAGIGLAIQLVQIATAMFFIVLFSRGLDGYFLGSILAGLVGLVLGSAALRRSLSVTFSSVQFREYVRFGLPLALAGLSAPFFMLADRLILARYAGMDSVAIFAVASTIASSMTLLGAAFSRAWSPMVWRMRFEDANYREQIAQVLVYLLTAFAFIAVVIATFASEIVAIVTPVAYRDAALVVPPLALYMVLNASTQVTALGISLEGRTRYFALLYWLALALNVVLDFVLVRAWQAVGIAVATLSAELFLTLAMAAVSQSLHPLPYHLWKITILAVVTVTFTVATFFLPNVLSFENIGIKIVFIVAFAISLPCFGVIRASEIRRALSLFGIERLIASKD